MIIFIRNGSLKSSTIRCPERKVELKLYPEFSDDQRLCLSFKTPKNFRFSRQIVRTIDRQFFIKYVDTFFSVFFRGRFDFFTKFDGKMNFSASHQIDSHQIFKKLTRKSSVEISLRNESFQLSLSFKSRRNISRSEFSERLTVKVLESILFSSP